MTSSVFNWRFERLDEARLDDVSAEENAFVRIVLKRFNEVNFDWSFNHSEARSQRHFDNSFSRSDLRYWCWHCWRFCRKFAISLYSSNSDLSHVVESKISIFWSLSVDFAFFTFFFAIFRSACFRALVSLFCCCEEKTFVRVVLKMCKKSKCDCFWNHLKIESLRQLSKNRSRCVFRYRYKCWQCFKFRRKFEASLKCLRFESLCFRLESKRSISRSKS